MMRPEARTTQTRIGAVDGLRAIAMTMVVLQHCELLPFGWMGVWLFYVVSGFVVCGTFHRQSQSLPDAPGRVVREFFVRRALRIWPIYFLYIGLTVVFLLASASAYSPGDVATLLTFLYNWQMIFQFAGPSGDWAGFGHLWTISVEQQFYLLFPLIYFFALATRPRPALLVVLMLAAPVARFFLGATIHQSHDSDEAAAFSVYASSLGQFDAFLIGALIARFADRIGASRWIEAAAWAAAISGFVVYVAAEVYMNIGGGQRRGLELVTDIVSGILYGHMQEVFVYYLPLLGAAAIIVSILRNRAAVGWLALRPLRWIGEISYGCYIFHVPILLVTFHFLGTASAASLGQRLVIFLIAYSATLVLAWVSYRYFESAFHRLRPGRRRSDLQTAPPIRAGEAD